MPEVSSERAVTGNSKSPGLAYLHYGDPGLYPPLIRGVELLAKRGWRVHVFGVRLDADRQAEFSAPFGVHVNRSDGTKKGIRRRLHYLGWSLRCLRRVIRRELDWVYVSDPRAAPAGLLCGRLTKSRVLYHEHDAPRRRPRRPEEFMIRKCRDSLARRAAVCVAPNAGRLELLPPASDCNQLRFAVRNAPLRRELRPASGLEQDCFEILFVGSVAPSRIPLTVVEALGRLPDVRLRIVGYETVGHPGYVKDLMRRARRLGVDERVRWEGFVMSFDDLPDAIRDADVGLCLMPSEAPDPNERRMAGASNKPFQFLACGVPLLVTDRPEWREMFVERGVARACRPERPDSIVEALRWFLDHLEESLEMGRTGRRLVKENWNYETEFAPVIEALERSLQVENGVREASLAGQPE